MPKSSYLSRKILNHVLGDEAYLVPGNLFLALFLSVDGLAVNVPSAEVSGAGYARMPCEFETATVAGSGAKIVLKSAVDFPQALENWGMPMAWAVMDAAAGGNVLYFGDIPPYGPQTSPEYKRVDVGDVYRIREVETYIMEG